MLKESFLKEKKNEKVKKNEKERKMVVEVDNIRVPGSDELFLEQAIDCVKKTLQWEGVGGLYKVSFTSHLYQV